MIDLVAFGVILDDIVFPDGATAMGVLGGGGPQTAFGMRLWSPSVGLAARLNPLDLPIVQAWQEESGIDPHGLIVNDLPTPRAWQLLEEDGRRTQVWRVPGAVIASQLRRSLDLLPEEYRHGRGYHFGIHPDEPELAFIEDLRSLGGLVSLEPFKPAEARPSPAQLRDLLTRLDVFSANLLEAQSLVGEGQPVELAGRLLDAGAPVVVIRQGELGSLVAGRGGPLDRPGAASTPGAAGHQTPVLRHIPAVPVQVIDPVGAGNAYCGGFLAGLVATGDLVTAGVWGAVAASFLVEQVGVPSVTPARQALALQRAQRLLTQIHDPGPAFLDGADP